LKLIKRIQVSSTPTPPPFERFSYLKNPEEQNKNLSLLHGLEEEKGESTPRFGEMMFNAFANKHTHREHIQPPM
jgi:hypothetical protein